ncbi:MAG: hypothetical protein ABIR91_05780 [Candidatus Saccharimonadales bacterium]
MQPNNEQQDWRQPDPQSSQAPYVAPPLDQPGQTGPIVTLQPDDPINQPSTDTTSDTTAAVEFDGGPIHWQAMEYIQRDKTPIWFIAFGLAFVALMFVAIFLIRSITFDVLVPIMAASLLMYVYRPPRMLDYTLSGKGLYVNDHLYPFAEFKSFGVIKDDEQYSIQLVPVKRFKPGVSIYFPEEVGEVLVDMLGTRLPMQQLKLDFVDKIIRKLRI